MTQNWMPDRDLQRAAETFLARAQPNRTADIIDGHALIQQFGGPEYNFTVGEAAIHVIAKPCVLYEWTIDALTEGDLKISLLWSNWQIPRNWLDMVGTGRGPGLSAMSNANGNDLDDWVGPLTMDRRDAIQIQIVEASNISAFTLVLYMKELPQLSTKPVVLNGAPA